MTTKQKKRSLKASSGLAVPLGASVDANGVNFAVYASNASGCDLLIFKNAEDVLPEKRVPMNRSGDIWHVHIEGIGARSFYLFSVDGPDDPANGHRYNKNTYLLDPYARMVTGASGFVAPASKDSATVPKCVVLGEADFDWQNDMKPNTPMAESIIYEVHLRGFTAHKTSPVLLNKGTYLGFIEMIPYLKKLGVTAVELMPIMEWYRPTKFVNPNDGTSNRNDWGYDTLAFMAPDEGLATFQGQQVVQFKQLVRELHKAGIEVILDIVLNHSAESDQTGSTISFRGLDNKVYYLLLPGHADQYVNYTGCGNTVNTNHPVVTRLILDVLKTWVEEFHVDGFRFDLGAVFGIDTDLSVRPDTPLLTAMVKDPVLSKVKLIAEPWSIGAYLMGRFPEPFSEWSDRYRDTVRGYVRAEPGMVRDLMAVISGSTDVFGSSGSRLPVNFFTAHDGFSAMDLVSYESKHNQANGEGNRDGSDHNRSWNCGFEGDLSGSGLSEDAIASIEQLRKKQIKNFYTLLMLSRGVPMILFGDEMGKTNFGNNNVWNQAGLNELDWSLLDKNDDLHRFVEDLILFRKEHKLGGKGHDPKFRPIKWHGTRPEKPDDSHGARFVAFELQAFEGEAGQSIYCASNAYWESIEVTLPDGSWYRIVDTSASREDDICVDYQLSEPVNGKVVIQPRSTLVFLSKEA